MALQSTGKRARKGSGVWTAEEPLELTRADAGPSERLVGGLCRPSPGVSERGLVLLVHGLGEHRGRYPHVVETLLAAGWAVAGFDHRGHGRSTGERGDARDLWQLADDVRASWALVRERVPGGAAFLYGHSMGGSLVLAAMLGELPSARPDVDGVLCTAPGLRPADTPPRWKIWAARIALKLRPRQRFHNGVTPTGISRDPDVIARYEADPLVHGWLSARLGLSLLTVGEELLQRAPDLDRPALLMHGEADRVTSIEASRTFVDCAGAEARFLSWPGLFHELHNEPEWKDVLAAALEWMAEVPIRSRSDKVRT